jgi:hypothetical protein
MRRISSLRGVGGAAAGIGVALAAALVVTGVVMAGAHEPIPIAHDATRPGNTQVATFALG